MATDQDDKRPTLTTRLTALEQLVRDLGVTVYEMQARAFVADDRRTELLATMAATVAAGIAPRFIESFIVDEEQNDLAATAVDIARRILAAVEKP